MIHPIQDPAWETVHLISDYFDHPLKGLADFDGQPHVFFLIDEVVRRVPVPVEEGGSEEDDFEVDTIYALHPASPELVSDLTEKHAIFERWHQAYVADRTMMQHHPALPSDRARYNELLAKVGPNLDSLHPSSPPITCQGRFARGRRPVAPGCSDWGSFEVQWLR